MLRRESLETDMGSWGHRDFPAAARAEHDAICAAFVERVRVGLLPPDEAYWWARILATDARTRLTGGSGCDWSSDAWNDDVGQAA